jgi:hypothetical protein
MVEIGGVATLFLNGIPKDTIHNTWTESGLWDFAALLTNTSNESYLRGAMADAEYLDSNRTIIVTNNSIFTVYGEKLYSNGATISNLYLEFPIKSSIGVSPPITIPTGFTFGVEWANTLSAVGFSATALSLLVNGISAVSKPVINPNSICITYASGTAYTTISEMILEGGNYDTIAVFKGSFLTGSYSNIATISLYRDSTLYVSNVVSPFSKDAETELYIEVRNTFSAV